MPQLSLRAFSNAIRTPCLGYQLLWRPLPLSHPAWTKSLFSSGEGAIKSRSSSNSGEEKWLSCGGEVETRFSSMTNHNRSTTRIPKLCHDKTTRDTMTTTTTSTTMMTTMTTVTETTTATTRWYNDTATRSLNPNAFDRLKLSTFNDAWQEFVHFLQ